MAGNAASCGKAPEQEIRLTTCFFFRSNPTEELVIVPVRAFPEGTQKMMPVATPGSGEWRNLPDAQLETLANVVGKRTIRFISYKTRHRPEPESQDGIVTRPLLYEGLVEVEGQRFRAEYVVSGQTFSSGQPAEPEIEAIPLEWEDKGNPSTPTEELGDLTLAVLEAHRLLTALASHH